MSFNLEFTGKHCIVKLLLQVVESMHTHAHIYVYVACKKILFNHQFSCFPENFQISKPSC